MIVMMALCPWQEHYLLCYCSLGLSITRLVMFVLGFCVWFWYHAIIWVPSFHVMSPTMKCMTCFLPVTYMFVSCSFILSLCRWITPFLAARY
jgi:hypothetical protein